MSDISSKTIIGRLERVSLPTFNINNIEAKIDTGAYNCALHVSEVASFEKNGIKHIRFVVLDEEHPEFSNEPHETSNFVEKLVKSSNGESTLRYQVPAILEIAGQQVEALFGLTDRTDMKFPILIGRKALKRKFIVDVSKKNIH